MTRFFMIVVAIAAVGVVYFARNPSKLANYVPAGILDRVQHIVPAEWLGRGEGDYEAPPLPRGRQRGERRWDDFGPMGRDIGPALPPEERGRGGYDDQRGYGWPPPGYWPDDGQMRRAQRGGCDDLVDGRASR